MRDELLHYYERELRFIRRQLGDFADRYPAVASQLLLEPDKCEDPHVERLIESFAMLTARVQMRLDDDFPEVTSAFLDMLHPHYLAPLPSSTIVQFMADKDGAQGTSAVTIPRHSQIHTPPVSGVRCRFRTTSPVDLWPVAVTGVDVIPVDRGDPVCPPEAVAAVRIKLRTLGGQPFAALDIGALRFFLDGNATTAHGLYELMLRDPVGLLVRSGQGGISASRIIAGAHFLPPDAIRPVGFGPDEGLYHYPHDTHLGHRLVQEYFCFPDKFMFVEMTGLDSRVLGGIAEELEILVLLDRLPLELEAQLGPENLKLGCVPAVNLFPHQADPVVLDRTASEHRVLADMHSQGSYEINSVESVETVEAGTGEVRIFRPFFALRHGDQDADEVAFWRLSRRPSPVKRDKGTEVYLTLVDPRGAALAGRPGDTLIVRTLASNRDLPAELPLGTRGGEFRIEGQPGVERILTLRKPTPAIRTEQGREALWRLVSLLNLNHLSLLEVLDTRDGRRGPVALREMLALLDATDTPVTRQWVRGLTGLQWRRVTRQVSVPEGRLLTRGLEITLDFDPSAYAGSGAFIFATVLERFLAHYTSINSFTQTVATTHQGTEVMKRWPPRAGETLLI